MPPPQLHQPLKSKPSTRERSRAFQIQTVTAVYFRHLLTAQTAVFATDDSSHTPAPFPRRSLHGRLWASMGADSDSQRSVSMLHQEVSEPQVHAFPKGGRTIGSLRWGESRGQASVLCVTCSCCTNTAILGTKPSTSLIAGLKIVRTWVEL